MTQPSKGAAVFMTCFGLMFLVPSLLFFLLVVVAGPKTSFPQTLAAAMGTLMMATIGGGLVYASIAGYGKMKQQAAIEEANPLSPWLWKKDWAASRAESQNKGKEFFLWFLCIFVNFIVLPITLGNAPQLIQRFDPRALLILGFDAAGLILLAYAVRASLRRRRFGKTWFELYSLPFSPGSRLTGRIHLKLNANAAQGVNLNLSCIRKTVTGSGNSRSTVESILWQADQNIPPGSIAPDNFGQSIPVDFALPADAYVTDQDDPHDQVFWRLHADADLPGVNYTDDFELPVFKTSSTSVQTSPDSFAAPVSGFATTTSSDSDAVTAPAFPKVVVSPQAGGTEFYFRALRAPAHALLLGLFTAIWTAVVYFLFHEKGPWIFAVVFSIADVFLILGFLHVTVGSARIFVGNGELTSTRRTLGIGSTKRFPFSEIDAILPVSSGQQAGNARSAIYAIRLRTKAGKRVTLADEISSRQEARWIVSQLESLVGLKINTRVEVDAPFGAASQPPQPLYGGSQSGAAWQTRRRSPVASGVSIAIFVSVAAGMFAYQGWRFSTFKSFANSRGSRGAAAAAPTKVPPRRVFAAPLANADTARILSLSAQDQAEELLERAIGHDLKALDLFDRNVENWVGHINLTDRMKQLEYRSQYSKDLRVRYASADISLTLDGWQKNDQAADLLIERAKTDQQYRAAAVYFLGMLAGRGVAYDKIHPVLLNYAQHDPDAVVRQWAVEGLRFLGKDEALDELWESFTQDPSMSVRNRAGCNLSDCGNFTRVQRMRMVPKFLELLGEPNLNSQMKTWCFMALREITDANVSSDVQSWRNWYGQNGAGKLAEFEQLDWWQVRGDE